MGFKDLFKREKRSTNLNNPAVSLASPGVWSWLTGSAPTAAGEEVNHFTAMQTTTVYACVRVIAESCGSLPLKLYELTATGKQEAFDAPLYSVLAYEPNIEMSAVTFWETFVGSMALTGNAYAEIVWNQAGQVDSLWPLHPLKTEPYRLPNGTLAFRSTDGEANGRWREIDAANMLHVPLLSYDGLKGLSPIMQARQGIGLTRAAEKFGARFFGNGSRPGGIMSTSDNFNEQQQQNIRESWERGQAGVSQGKTAFLFGNWNYEAIGLTPEESQFLSTRQFQRTEIAGLFRVPPHMIGDTSRLSNSNHEQQSLEFVTDTLRPYLSKVESEIIRKLLPSTGRKANKYVAKFDVSERLRGDFATTQKGYQTGVMSGWMSRNEVRLALGMNPGPADLDAYMAPINMQNAERLLDTESIQDQPLAATPTPQERQALSSYHTAYIRMFRDAVGRVANREKRDGVFIGSAFQPILESIANLTADGVRGNATDWNFDCAKTIATHLKSLEDRAKDWTTARADIIAATELTRAVKTLVFASHRAIGEYQAEQLLKETA